MEKRNICLALGFFDSVHIGHRKIISSVKELSYKYNSDACVMTFKNNIYGVVKKDSKLFLKQTNVRRITKPYRRK